MTTIHTSFLSGETFCTLSTTSPSTLGGSVYFLIGDASAGFTLGMFPVIFPGPVVDTQPYVSILEQPKARGLRFRYECEGRAAGSIPGENSKPEARTYPKIQVTFCSLVNTVLETFSNVAIELQLKSISQYAESVMCQGAVPVSMTDW